MMKTGVTVSGAQTTDYYRKKPRESCPVRLPRFFFKMAEICVTPTKPLPCRAFRLDGLITPTL